MHLHMGWPQIIVVTLMLLSLGIAMARYGETKAETYNGYNFVGPILFLGLLYWGGFFS
jgi:hypothetical protein